MKIQIISNTRHVYVAGMKILKACVIASQEDNASFYLKSIIKCSNKKPK